jgi:hypothetical protein
MKKSFVGLTLFILLGFALNNTALCWDNETTHMQLSEYAVDNSILDKDSGDYLRNLGFIDALGTRVKWGEDKSIKKWFQDGAKLEDSYIFSDLLNNHSRFNNHFHNPLKPWEQAGLDDTILFVPVTGKSSLLWAQDGVYQQGFTAGDWSWEKTRDYFYLALTSATDPARQEYFARTFRGLGHQMHLIQDGAVPDHARNDAHPFTRNKYGVLTIEAWAAGNYTTIDSFATSPQVPAMSFDPSQYELDSAYYTGNLVPSALFIDTDQYDAQNPSQFFTSGLATSNVIGITEYTNANFTSQHTIFKENLSQSDPHYFPYPKESSTNLQELISKNILPETVTAEDGVQELTLFIKKERDGEIIDHFVKPTYTKTSKLDYIGGGTVYALDFYLDETCHADYAQKLIPRAVGYSAGLLNYFFRGNLEISAPDTYVYSITDGSVTPQQFTHIKAKVLNTTPNENIQNGILQAVARYKVIPNYSPDLSNYPPDGVVMKTIDFSYSVSEPITLTTEEITSLNTQPTEFTFDFTADTIPAGITDLSLQVVFKGTLGSETDIAIAVGMKDLMEPTHHIFWNLTDMFSLDGHLYIADDIRNDPRVAGAYIDPHDINFEIAYMGESPPASSPIISATGALPAGRHIRLLVLVDRQDNNYVRIKYSSVPYPNEKYGDVLFQGVTNQEVNGTWQATPVDVFRTVRGHFSQGVIVCVPNDGSGICPYPEEEAIPVADLTPYPAIISFPEWNIIMDTLDFLQSLQVKTQAETGICQGEGLISIVSNSQELTKTSKQINPENATDLTPPDITIAAPTEDNLVNSNQVPYSASITFDTTAPILTVSTLSDGSWTNNELLNVSGQVTDNTGIQRLTINDVAVTINPDGSFSYPVVLQDGPNTVGIRVTDLAGNEASDMRTINLDQDAPVITIATPADNMNTKQSWIDVTGTVDDQSTVTLEVDAANPMAALMNDNNFSLTVGLVYGINTVEVTATDFASNISRVKRTVTFDDQNPSLSVTYPAQDIKTNQSTITIRGEVTDLNVVTITVTMDGNIYTPVVTSGRFEQTVTFTEGKTYQIYVKAVDEAGNETLVQRNVVYDITAPAR